MVVSAAPRKMWNLHRLIVRRPQLLCSVSLSVHNNAYEEVQDAFSGVGQHVNGSMVLARTKVVENMSPMACLAALLALVAAAAVPAFATDYTVGDSNGWTTGIDYSTWASDKTFKVGDTLLFQYTGLHTVDEVTKSDYDGCSSSNSIKSYNDQNTKITLDKAGGRYFICGTPGHCTGGMKLAVSVASGSPTTPSSGGSSPSTPSTPSATPSGSGSKEKPSNGAAGKGVSGVMVGVTLVGLGLGLMG